jgi:hypothetical protein
MRPEYFDQGGIGEMIGNKMLPKGSILRIYLNQNVGYWSIKSEAFGITAKDF